MSRTSLALLLALFSVAPGPAPARTQTHVIQLRSNFFFPGNLHISPGDTVVWEAVEQGHTVATEDRRFSWPPGNRTMDKEATFSFTFPIEETVRFFCRVHGQAGGPKPGGYNMIGTIVVGRGAPSGSGAPQTRNVPSEYPSIQSALSGASPGSTIRVAPGTYSERVQAPDWARSEPPISRAWITVATPGVTIEGTGDQASQTVLDGLGEWQAGIDVAADNVTIRNVRMQGFTKESVGARSVSGFTVDRVESFGAGVVVSDTTGATISRSVVRGATLAGVQLSSCDACRVEAATVTESFYGVLADHVDGVVIRESVLSRNGTGIAVRAASESVTIEANTITDNTAPFIPASSVDFVMPAGVWLAGAVDAVVRGNAISGHLYGVMIAAIGAPTIGARIQDNVFQDSERADFGFDGRGANVCIAGNATTLPENAATIYSCDLPATIGVPEPQVIEDFVVYARPGII